MKVSVPGKALLLGEYAVLEGAPAMVAAVSARAVGRRVPRRGRESPVVQAVRTAAEALGTTHGGGLEIDTDGFRGPRRNKLGLGSSAASAVAAAALLRGRTDETVYRAALEGHRAAARGKGSGVDVCAAYRGGVLACAYQPGPVEALPSEIPGLHLAIFHLGPSAKTSSFIRACRAAPSWNRWVQELADLAGAGVAAYRSADAGLWLNRVRAFGRAMEGLGHDAGVPVVTEPCRRLMDGAEALGGAAKPAGAGGGDVAVAWLPDRSRVPELAEQVGLRALHLSVDPVGLRREAEALE